MVSVPVTCARLAGRVVTVGDEMPVLAPSLAARTCAVAARCSAALLGLLAVMGDCCAPSLGACVSNRGHVAGFTITTCLTDGHLTHAPSNRHRLAGNSKLASDHMVCWLRCNVLTSTT